MRLVIPLSSGGTMHREGGSYCRAAWFTMQLPCQDMTQSLSHLLVLFVLFVLLALLVSSSGM